MCGIFAFASLHPRAISQVIQGLKKLEYRGYDSWGVAWVDESSQKLLVEKHVGKIGTSTVRSPSLSKTAIGHTRWATHGGVNTMNSHPQVDCAGMIAVVHNGIVENYLELKAGLEQNGHVFVSETDTEVIAHLIEEERTLLSKGAGFDQAVRRAFCQLTGLNAITAMDLKSGTLVAVTNGSPLVIGRQKGFLVVASDVVALGSEPFEIHYLADLGMVVIRDGDMQCIDLLTGERKEVKWQAHQLDAKATELESYPHYMIKEICEQPGVIKHVSNTIGNSVRSKRKDTFLPQSQTRRIWMVGCGTAGYAALFGQYVFSRAGWDARAVQGSEFGECIQGVRQTDLVIFLSQSGETIDLIEHARVLKQKGMKILAIINREESTLSRLADNVIPLSAGPEQCVLATKSFTSKLCVLISLCSQDIKTTKLDMELAIEELTRMITQKYRILTIQPLAKQLAPHTTLFVIGRGAYYPLALEAALKIKEVTYIHAEGIAGGELKHGVIALIEQGTPCIVFALEPAKWDMILSNAMELKARGAMIIGISHQPHPCFDTWIDVKQCGEATAIASITPIQLLAYEIALILGRDPDKPRNLAKSVTVR